MRIAVFRGELTINHGTDTSSVIVDRLRMLGHEVLHTTAVAHPGQVVPEELERDFIAPDSVQSFDPQALAIIIPSPDHEYFPREVIEATVRGGGTVVYIGPANGATGESPARRFLAERGFFFESITPKGPQPVRCWTGAWIHLPIEMLHQGGPFGAFGGVYFLQVRTPFVLASQQGQRSILQIPVEDCCLWDGTPLPRGMGLIGAMRETTGQEILLTGDWFSPPSLATLTCNTQFIVNLLTTAASGDPSCAEQPSAGHATPVGQAKATLMISAATQSRPFIDLVVDHLRKRGFGAVVSCDDTDLSDRIPGNLSAFVSIIDRDFSARQEAEANAAIAATRTNPDSFRLIPINFRLDFKPYQVSGALRELAEWVWLPAHDSREWKRIFDLLVRVLNRPHGRFAWGTTGKGRRTFVSYSFRDYDLAARLVDRLVTIGLDVFLADETTLMNSHLRQELTRLIVECDVFIPVITPEYRNSNWSFVEAEVATQRFRHIGKPQVLLFAMKDERIPHWCKGFPVYQDFEGLKMALTTR